MPPSLIDVPNTSLKTSCILLNGMYYLVLSYTFYVIAITYRCIGLRGISPVIYMTVFAVFGVSLMFGDFDLNFWYIKYLSFARRYHLNILYYIHLL